MSTNENAQFDSISSKGIEDGLYQSCMKSIRNAHFQANRLRAGLVLAGLFTDAELYREVISLFYIVTSTMESKLNKLAKEDDEICKKILELGYNFTPHYESDLQYLYGEDWNDQVEACKNNSAVIMEYKEKIESMKSGIEIIGPCFVLWGALIIGGGAAVMPKVEKLCGSKACNLFKDITGPGRMQRRQEFIKVWDSLVDKMNEQDFSTAVKVTEECMQCNNDIFTSLQRNPWWLGYVYAASAVFVGGLSVVSVRWFLSENRSSH